MSGSSSTIIGSITSRSMLVCQRALALVWEGYTARSVLVCHGALALVWEGYTARSVLVCQGAIGRFHRYGTGHPDNIFN